MNDDEECRQDEEEYRKRVANLVSRIREKPPGPLDCLLGERQGITEPGELVGKQVARILTAKHIISRLRTPILIEFTDGSFATAYLARETDEDWAGFHASFHAAWTKARGGRAIKSLFQQLEYLLLEWGIDTLEYRSPRETAATLVLDNDLPLPKSKLQPEKPGEKG